MNSGISEDLASISYMHMDEVFKCILSPLGATTKMIKIDLESAYRQIPVHPYMGGKHLQIGPSHLACAQHLRFFQRWQT